MSKEQTKPNKYSLDTDSSNAEATSSSTSSKYYDKCSVDETDVIKALDKMGIEGSVESRKSIAIKNNIPTSNCEIMNEGILKLLKEGNLLR